MQYQCRSPNAETKEQKSKTFIAKTGDDQSLLRRHKNEIFKHK